MMSRIRQDQNDFDESDFPRDCNSFHFNKLRQRTIDLNLHVGEVSQVRRALDHQPIGQRSNRSGGVATLLQPGSLFY